MLAIDCLCKNLRAQVARTKAPALTLLHQCLERCRGVAVCDALGFHAGLVLVQHQGGDALQGLLGQGLEGDDFIHAAKELRAQELRQCLAGLFLAALGVALVKAKAARALVAAAGVGGHADDRVGKIHRASLRIVDLALVQNLQQNVHHVRVCLFDLIEQHHTVGAAAHLLGELTGFLIAHIARRRADHAGHRIFFHVLAHVQTNERVGRQVHLFVGIIRLSADHVYTIWKVQKLLGKTFLANLLLPVLNFHTLKLLKACHEQKNV